MLTFIVLIWWALMLAVREIDELKDELVEVKSAAAETMQEAMQIDETAKANHRYANHLLRVARDHEVRAKAYLKETKRRRGE